MRPDASKSQMGYYYVTSHNLIQVWLRSSDRRYTGEITWTGVKW